MKRYFCFSLPTVRVLRVSCHLFTGVCDKAHSDSTLYTNGFCLPAVGGLLASEMMASDTVAVNKHV